MCLPREVRCQAAVNIFNQQAIFPRAGACTSLLDMPVKLPELEEVEESREEEVMEMRRGIQKDPHTGEAT